MSAEISSGDHVAEISNGAATVNGTQEMNGVSNGYIDKHKSSSKDKHRDQKHSSSKHSSSSNREKEKHSSSGKEKERSSSHKSSRDKDRDKERSDKVRTEKDRSDKDRSDKERSNKDRSDKERSEKERSDKDRSNKDRSDKDRHRSKDHKSSRDKDREKDKKDGSNSEKDKDRKHKHSSKDKEKEVREKEKKEDGSKSSSNRDKDKERSRDKDREKDRKDRKDKHKSSSSSHKSSRDKVKSESRSPEKKIKSEHGVSVKNEDSVKEEIKVEPDIYEEKPDINTSQSSCDYSLSQFKEDESLFKEEVKVEQDDVKLEEDEDSEEDIPLSKKLAKHNILSDSEDDVPILKRTKKQKVEKKSKKTKKRKVESDDDFEEEEEVKPKKKKTSKSVKNEVVSPSKQNASPTKRKKKEEEPEEVWKWWEEEKKDDGTKWKFLEHKGPLFAPPYERLPSNVKFYYDGKEFQLSETPEEIACFYAKMLEHDFTSKKVFNENFFKDWRKSMNEKERSVIKDLTKCDFRKMNAYFTAMSEKNKQKTKEEKLAIKQKNEEMIKEYGFCTIDGHKEKIGNFRIEPPGLFRGRGEHPKMGMVKKRVMPEQIMINCSKDSVYPKAPQGHKWKEIRHDNTVTWLVSWTENVQNQVKYVMLNPSSKLKGEKDWQKYETARKLHKCIDKIRQTYQSELKAKEMKIRQRAVALYFIDKLALRAGNEKDEDQADTVGCCSLRVEHIQLFKQKDGKDYVVVFDFLGKDSIRYYNEVPVEKRVFKNLELFKENKKDGDDLFDRLNTMVMNDHLRDLMEGLSAKVFRTYNASITLQKQLEELTDPDSTLQEKLLSYNRANRAVAVLCNHQRAIPKSHDKSMNNLRDKINQKRELIEETEAEVRDLAKAAKRGSVRERTMHEKKKNALDKLKEQLKKMEVQETDRDENKTIALGTSKLNYLDPRISVAWCKKFGVPIDKIYNKTQRDKFRWAVDMATEDYVF